MGDIDLLIHRRDYARAAACLRQLGFLSEMPRLDYVLKYAWAHHFRRPADNVWIDLQWNICQREWDAYGDGNCDLEIARVWRNARPICAADYSLLVPSPEDMLFHLCMHLEGHRYCELILLCDIAELVGHYAGRFDWEYVVGLARRYRAEASIYYALLTTQRLFDASIPAAVLEDLQPAYFPAPLFDPLFAHLAPLHFALDEIQEVARPEAATMRKFEACTRRQALVSMQAFRAVDQLVRSMVQQGATALVHGSLSPRVFPVAGLEPFTPIELFCLAEHLPILLSALERVAFERIGSKSWRKRWRTATADPLLQDEATEIACTGSVITELMPDLLQPAASPSKKALALRALRRRSRPAAVNHLHLQIVALPPEELLACIAVRVGRAGRDRLFESLSVDEFFRAYHGRVDWNRFRTVAEIHGVLPSAQRGLAAVVSSTEIPREFAAPEHLLDTARYDPAAFGRYSQFKGLFFWLLALLHTESAREKVRFAASSLFGRNRVLISLAREALSRSGPSSEPQDQRWPLAYWTQVPPVIAGEIEGITRSPLAHSAQR